MLICNYYVECNIITFLSLSITWSTYTHTCTYLYVFQINVSAKELSHWALSSSRWRPPCYSWRHCSLVLRSGSVPHPLPACPAPTGSSRPARPASAWRTWPQPRRSSAGWPGQWEGPQGRPQQGPQGGLELAACLGRKLGGPVLRGACWTTSAREMPRPGLNRPPYQPHTRPLTPTGIQEATETRWGQGDLRVVEPVEDSSRFIRVYKLLLSQLQLEALLQETSQRFGHTLMIERFSFILMPVDYQWRHPNYEWTHVDCVCIKKV